MRLDGAGGKSEVVLGQEIPQENLVSLDSVNW